MKKILSFFVLLIITLIFVSQTASAQLLNNTTKLTTMTNAFVGEAHVGTVSIGYLVGSIIKVVLSLLSIIFLILLLIAGLRWMMANGNDEVVKKASAAIKSAIIGLIIVLGAYAITYFVFNYLPFTGGSAMPQAR